MLASKFFWLVRNNDSSVLPQQALDHKNIRAVLDNSLRRLNTNHLDLCQIHWPQSSTNALSATDREALIAAHNLNL
jgi:aryl-alcohol dehydrogenase-like predicted oxidoreductase